VGNALADRLGVGEAAAVGDVVLVAVADAVGDVVPVAVADAVGDVVEPAEGLAVVLAGLLPGTAVGEAEPVTDGVKMAGVVVEELAEQAESATQARMTMTPQPMAVSRTPGPVPAMVVRTFMEPPGGSAGGEFVSRFQRKKRPRNRKVRDQHGGHRGAMACSALEY
jgi:hypothetical protein